MMESEKFNRYIENVDAWIKQINTEVSSIQDVNHITEENVNNIQHNYELICELKDDIIQLRNELNTIKLIQIASLKENIQKSI